MSLTPIFMSLLSFIALITHLNLNIFYIILLIAVIVVVTLISLACLITIITLAVALTPLLSIFFLCCLLFQKLISPVLKKRKAQRRLEFHQHIRQLEVRHND